MKKIAEEQGVPFTEVAMSMAPSAQSLMGRLEFEQSQNEAVITPNGLFYQELNTVLDFAEDQARYKRWNEAQKDEIRRNIQSIRRTLGDA